MKITQYKRANKQTIQASIRMGSDDYTILWLENCRKCMGRFFIRYHDCFHRGWLLILLLLECVYVCFYFFNGLLTRARQRDLNPLRIHMVMVTGNFSLPHIFVFALAFVYVFFLLCSPHFFTSSKHNLFFSKFLFLRLLATKCDWWLHFSHSPVLCL